MKVTVATGCTLLTLEITSENVNDVFKLGKLAALLPRGEVQEKSTGTGKTLHVTAGALLTLALE